MSRQGRGVVLLSTRSSLFSMLPFTGQSAALIHDIVPAGELVAHLVDQTADALNHANEVAGVT